MAAFDMAAMKEQILCILRDRPRSYWEVMSIRNGDVFMAASIATALRFVAVEKIATTRMAERRRCARIARSHAQGGGPGNSVALDIAEEIENLKDEDE